MKIGLLEDNPAILDYMTIALEMAGHEVYTYIQSDALIETLLSGSEVRHPLPYDLIIVDLLLPGYISGLEAIKYIHHVIPPSQLPVIIISAGSQEEVAAAKTILPYVPVVQKPFTMSHLLGLMNGLKVA